MRSLIIAALLCLIAGPARADIMLANRDLIERYFQGDEPIFISFADGIKDGCLPRPDAVRSAIEAGLRRAGLTPTDNQGNSRWTLLISAAGSEMKARDGSGTNTCYAGVEARLVMRWAFRDLIRPEEQIRLAVTGLEGGSIMYGGKPSMQRRINGALSDLVDEFAYEILQAIER
jgi:hypothetical protein